MTILIYVVLSTCNGDNETCLLLSMVFLINRQEGLFGDPQKITLVNNFGCHKNKVSSALLSSSFLLFPCGSQLSPKNALFCSFYDKKNFWNKINDTLSLINCSVTICSAILISLRTYVSRVKLIHPVQ